MTDGPKMGESYTCKLVALEWEGMNMYISGSKGGMVWGSKESKQVALKWVGV